MANQDTFDDIPSSLYAAVFLNGKRPDIKHPEHSLINNLGVVSALYLYTNPPPVAYGTPAPKVAETVLRSYGYNLKPDGQKIKVINGYRIDNPTWDDGTPFPFGSVNSNWHPGTCHNMAKRYLAKNITQISQIADEVIEHFLGSNSDLLTTGRQTWDPLHEVSIPSPMAYTRMCSFLEDNGAPKSHTLIEFIKIMFEVMNKDEIKCPVVIEGTMSKNKVVRGQRVEMTKNTKKVRTTNISGEESKRKMVSIMSTFASYLKHMERGHLDRRAIASPSMGFRAFQVIIEEFHLRLGKVVEGSTISIGGEEKKAKIITSMNKAATSFVCEKSIQSTQDAKKWNECLNAFGFGMLHTTWFDDTVRKELGLAKVTDNEKIFLQICLSSHFLLGVKTITLGEGLQGHFGDFHGKIPYREDTIRQFNARSQEWVRQIIPLRKGNNYIEASAGMLMGMFNALSTTIGLISVGYEEPLNTKMVTLRSSDDSMTLYLAGDTQSLSAAVDRERLNLKQLGINLSEAKTMYFPQGYGEYTSWYQDGKMVSQYGTEVTKLRPGGSSPADDFFSIAKESADSVLRLEMNPLGAEVGLKLGVNNVRDLYNIKWCPGVRVGVSAEVQLLSDGGSNMWDYSNCHLEESSLKKHFARTDTEKEYLLKVRNPDNPFIGQGEEQAVWSKDKGTLVLDTPENPRTIFHFRKRGNRAVLNIKGPTHADSEKDHAAALDILTMSDISTLIRVPGAGTVMSNHVAASMQLMRSGMTLTEDETTLFDSAIDRLMHDAEDDVDLEENIDFDGERFD